ncbi:adenylate/guanylate cyclase domain-containing protein [Corynebacterium terpenotabidum]|uniref:Adenylate cyclase n=1 Tax=Corynebacterium terpenotabidum Y-11 TaxID=1200352 RepID=S4XGN6_9CORY|nr:adenylate/guanylate cyclase domain-containing protein [Corynebacterium terpenotabidum]AGP31701.1 adenylate cyclase [Corynebacterium terpenotabidum Y-11]
MQRLARYIRWAWGTSWPLYAVSVLVVNVFGGLGVASFLRFLVPLPGAEEFLTVSTLTASLYVLYFLFAIVVGVGMTLFVFTPVLGWERAPDSYDPTMIRSLVLRIPGFQALLGAVLWAVGVVIFTVVAFVEISRSWALTVAVTSILGGAMVVLMTYMVAERMVRPVAVRAMKPTQGSPEKIAPLSRQITFVWLLTSAVPVVGVVLMVVGQASGFFGGDARKILPGVLALSVTELFTGFSGTRLLTMTIVDPIRELQVAMNRVRRGDTSAQVRIYDGTEVGVLQAGFNEMMDGLQERERVRELFGRYVGDEVARRAMEKKPTLGGENRQVGVIFVDVVGSTGFAVSREPQEVVLALNRFFDIVVEVVHRNKGIINKFEGDAALAVFGAPLPLDDIAGHTLAAARELKTELAAQELPAGIGAAVGPVVSGHIGAKDRFEYTVIGDAVNAAARLTDLAKETPGRVLTNATTVRQANAAEQARWTMMKSVELRGRREMTQLARPIRPTQAERAAEQAGARSAGTAAVPGPERAAETPGTSAGTPSSAE